MEPILLPLLVAAAVAMLAMGVWRLVEAYALEGRKKIAERLSTENRFDPLNAPSRAVKIQLDAAGLPSLLKRSDYLIRLNRKLVQTFPGVTLTQFLGLAAGLGFVFGLVMLLLTTSAVPALAAAGVAAYAPVLILNQKRARRQKAMCDQLPEALDFLSRALRAGHSLSTGVQMMADELPEPLSAEFRQCYDQHSLGQSLDDALKDMTTRIESTDLAFFVTAVLIQRQTGGDLSEVLRNISSMIRQRVRLQQQVKARTAEGRLTGYIMTGFPVVMFFIASSLSPEYGQILLHTPEGLRLVAIATVLQLVGLFAIKKITTVRV
jgi:tight adherence protein B